MVTKINQLAALHAQGILSDEEFASAKAKARGSRFPARPGWRSPRGATHCSTRDSA